MADKENNKELDPLAESDADSEAYTKDRIKAAEEKFERQRELDKEQFVFLGENEPELDIPDPEDRPLDMESFTEAEKEALKTQNEIASDSYEPKSIESYIGESFDSPDINEDAKEFQLKDDFTPSDEFTGPEAGAKAHATGYNPRTVATSGDPDGLVQEGVDEEGARETVKELTGRDADKIRDEQGGMPDGAEKVSKSSTDESPDTINK